MNRLWSSAPVSFLRQAVVLYFTRRIPQAAASLAYFMLLTVFPVLICVSSFLGLLNIDITHLMGELETLLPYNAFTLIDSYLRYITIHRSTGFFFAGLVACWFTSAAAFRTITSVIVEVYEDVYLPMIRGVLYSFIFPFALLLTVNLSIVGVVTSQRTLGWLTDHLPFLDQTMQVWSWIRYILLFCIFMLFVLAVLSMAAPRGTPKLPILLSALFSSSAFVVTSLIFSWFIGLSSRYSLVYGSLVSMIVLLIWLYLISQLLFLAIVFTGVWHSNWRRGNAEREMD